MIMKPFALLMATLALASASEKPLYNKAGSKSLGNRGIQQIECTDGVNGAGDVLRATDYIADLRDYDFDNRATWCCFDGIWILYDLVNYNTNDFEVCDGF